MNCHSERSEESTRDHTMRVSPTWILRCAQNDKWDKSGEVVLERFSLAGSEKFPRMSLINDAPQKAQRLRTETPFGASGRRCRAAGTLLKRGAPMQSQTIMLIVAGCVVLVVLSVVGTVYLLNGKSAAPKTIAVTPATPKTDPVRRSTCPSRRSSRRQSREKPEVKPKVAEVKPEVKIAPPTAAVVKTEEPKPEEPVVKPAATPPPVKPLPLDERVHVFLDALKVTGIRAGADSRVLMNETRLPHQRHCGALARAAPHEGRRRQPHLHRRQRRGVCEEFFRGVDVGGVPSPRLGFSLC